MNARRRLRPARRLVQALAGITIGLACSACSTLPARQAEPPPLHDAAPATPSRPGTLHRITARSLPSLGADGASGFRLLPSAEQALEARLVLIGAAEQRIDLQLYHLHADATGRALVNALAAAAGRGVQVRVLLDDLHIDDAAPLLPVLAATPGVALRLFNPLPARRGAALARLLFSAHDFDRVNRRMHNKLLVADGVLAIFGGRNAGDSYFMRQDGANFIDIDVLAAGAVAGELAAQFERYWASGPAWPAALLPGTPGLGDEPVPAGEAAIEAAAGATGAPGIPGSIAAHGRDRFARSAASDAARPDPTLIDPLGQPSLGSQLAAGQIALHPGTARVHADTPDKVVRPIVRGRAGEAMAALTAALASAEESVTVVSPYFVPGPLGLELIGSLAQRGLSPRIVTNSLGATDEPLVHRAYAEYRPRMLALGARLDEVSPAMVRHAARSGLLGRLMPAAVQPGLADSQARLHAKLALIDHRRLLVGSVNLDPRSAMLNTELLVDIASPALARDASRLLALLDQPGQAGAGGLYRLALAADGSGLRWHTAADDGMPLVLDEEPHDHPLARAWQRWLSRLVGELHL